MMFDGVPAGATRPHHEPTSYPGSPASATVGTSGKMRDRRALATASARNAPAFTCGTAGVIVMQVKEIKAR